MLYWRVWWLIIGTAIEVFAFIGCAMYVLRNHPDLYEQIGHEFIDRHLGRWAKYSVCNTNLGGIATIVMLMMTWPLDCPMMIFNLRESINIVVAREQGS